MEAKLNLAAPQPLLESHHFRSFSCGIHALDEWLTRRAPANQLSGATRTFVILKDGDVVAYYSLAAGAVQTSAAPGRFRRKMPDPIPVVVLARLAVDQRYHSRGIGRAMLGDCAHRVSDAADSIGIRGILVHALSANARAFYIAVGFDPSPIEPMTLMITLADIRRSLE